MILWVDFLIDFMNYYLIYKWIFGVTFRKQKLLNTGIIFLLSIATLTLCHLTGALSDGYAVLLCIIVTLLLCTIREQRKKALLLFPITFFLSGVINILGSYLISGVLRIPYVDMMASPYCKTSLELICPIILCIIALPNKKLRNKKEIIDFNVFQYLLGLLGTVCLFFVIAVSQGIMEGKTTITDWLKPLAVCIVIVGVLFIVLIIWMLFVEKRALEYKMKNEFFHEYLEKQEMHINDIIEADQKIRRFRHDINAHITALEQGIKMGDIDQLEQYIQRMREEIRSFSVKKYTGLKVVDAVISEWNQKATDEKIIWEWEGEIPSSKQLELYDLCVIFSNLLSNAVEATKQVENGREKIIQTSCGTFQDQICIRITNTCKLDVTENNIKTTSKKNDIANHGFGLRNVQNIVDSVQGEFTKKIDQGVFTAEIII